VPTKWASAHLLIEDLCEMKPRDFAIKYFHRSKWLPVPKYIPAGAVLFKQVAANVYESDDKHVIILDPLDTLFAGKWFLSTACSEYDPSEMEQKLAIDQPVAEANTIGDLQLADRTFWTSCPKWRDARVSRVFFLITQDKEVNIFPCFKAMEHFFFPHPQPGVYLKCCLALGIWKIDKEINSFKDLPHSFLKTCGSSAYNSAAVLAAYRRYIASYNSEVEVYEKTVFPDSVPTKNWDNLRLDIPIDKPWYERFKDYFSKSFVYVKTCKEPESFKDKLTYLYHRVLSSFVYW